MKISGKAQVYKSRMNFILYNIVVIAELYSPLFCAFCQTFLITYNNINDSTKCAQTEYKKGEKLEKITIFIQ